jgi:hydroxymethylpyrimidine kinase/phosphomethylpyrimidine kinase
VFATTAITAVTAQNRAGVHAVEGVSAEVLGAQIDAVLSAFPIAAIKTGMLWSAESVVTVTEHLRDTTVPVVVDPVMVATSGGRLLDPAAISAHDRLFRRAALVTPNLDEAAVLLGRALDPGALEDEAKRLRDRLGCPVLLKGGHLAGSPHDVLADRDALHVWIHARVEGTDTHGTGCILSSAIAARLAAGRALAEACADGLAFVHDALTRGGSGTVGGLPNIEAARIEPAHLRHAVGPPLGP